MKSDGGDGYQGGGGGSGGTIKVAGRYFEGHGKFMLRGGRGSSYCSGCCSHCCGTYYFGGGGGGGHLNHFSPEAIRRDILRHRDLSGGSSAGSGATKGHEGRICAANPLCSGHGKWSAEKSLCKCFTNYYGVECSYYCNPTITCLGNGQCTESGGCACNDGYVGYRCEHSCDPAVDCSQHGRCSVTGKCVCDPCYHGDKCQHLCSGNGTCIEDVCRCNTCFVGTYCDSECSGHGNCFNSTCLCDPIWKGKFCNIPRCPGDCSGNGICNSALLSCFCNPGWTDQDCSTPDCPGEPNCNGRGECVINGSSPVCLNCSVGWMGKGCDEPCVHGSQEPIDSGLCQCEPCWSGKGCDVLCMGRGKCQNNTCLCDYLKGWRGSVCEIPGCPGDGKDCSGNGDCNGANHKCTCFNGWTGIGCHIPDCPGAPDCFNRGYCNSSVDPPVCQNCNKGWMGPACSDPCKYGEQTPMDSGNCTCWPGYTGVGCDSECSEHGKVVSGKCQCREGWRGTLCDNPGCPGVELDCTGHGDCNSATHECTCNEGRLTFKLITSIALITDNTKVMMEKNYSFFLMGSNESWNINPYPLFIL